MNALQRRQARLHEALLSTLYPPSPPPPRPQKQQPQLNFENVDTSDPDPVYSGEEQPTSAESSGEEAELAKVFLTRAQRKHLRLKKVKQSRDVAQPSKRFIGPLQPGQEPPKFLMASTIKDNDEKTVSAEPLVIEDKSVTEDLVTTISKSKRRKLAKKQQYGAMKFSSSVFTAEATKRGITIKKAEKS